MSIFENLVEKLGNEVLRNTKEEANSLWGGFVDRKNRITDINEIQFARRCVAARESIFDAAFFQFPQAVKTELINEIIGRDFLRTFCGGPVTVNFDVENGLSQRMKTELLRLKQASKTTLDTTLQRSQVDIFMIENNVFCTHDQIEYMNWDVRVPTSNASEEKFRNRTNFNFTAFVIGLATLEPDENNTYTMFVPNFTLSEPTGIKIVMSAAQLMELKGKLETDMEHGGIPLPFRVFNLPTPAVT